MEKITDKIAALPQGSNYFSLEFFPPKTAMGSSNLRARLERMSRALHPLFVNVTWGAGGSTATQSLELAELCQRELGLTTCLHLTCTNMSRASVDRALDDAAALGIRNILALRGDPPRTAEYGSPHDEEPEVKFEWAIDLVRYIRAKYSDYFCIGVAAYPEGHFDHNDPEGQSLEHDLPYLVEKVQAGADFIMTQLFFDIKVYDAFEKRLREHESAAFMTLPIIPGMMPIQSYQMITRTTKLSHARMPPDIMARLDAVRGDDELVKKVGVDIVSQLVIHIQHSSSPATGRRGFHFYTLNLEKAVTFILERTSLIPPISPLEAENEYAIVIDEIPLSQNRSPSSPSLQSFRRHSSIGSNPHNRIIITAPETSHPDVETTARDAAMPAAAINSRANTLAISEGEGSLGREATWDDYPNGRWGDARSPAYGEIDGYGVNLHMSITQAIQLWGYPVSRDDISTLFIRHLEGSLGTIPWSEAGLNPETDMIKKQLLQLNRKGWWTLASQPAVNGVRSGDVVFGWGPRNGFVFQKAFVELFVPSKDWQALEARLTSPVTRESVSWYASNVSGEFRSSDIVASLHSSSRPSGSVSGHQQDAAETSTQPISPHTSTNAVTWGVFPGKEIITPTIIEEVSFRAWADEAFAIWREWEHIYVSSSPGKNPPPSSPLREHSHLCISRTAADVWLVNIIHHVYVEKDALWELLLS